jgi:hypothetical protein
MKRILFFGLISVLFSVSLLAETPLDVYTKSLKVVLDKIEKDYNVKITCEVKNPEKIKVENADWKFYSDVETTLDNILKPLDLRFNKKGDNQYEIKQWEYFRKPYEEGDKHLKKLLASYPTLEKWEIRKKEVKQNMLNKLGLNPLPQRNELNQIRSNFRKLDGYNAENIALEVLPGVYLSGTLYSPAKPAKSNPAMLCPHGHFYNKVDKSIPNERGRYREDQQKRCGMLARIGAYVFSYDMFAWGESNLQIPLKDHRTGLALTIQTWNSMRVVDFLLSMKQIDPARIGITAASGGGTQTFIAAALDNRITLSVPTVMVSAHFFGGCPCESGMPIHQMDKGLQTNNAEIAALFSPKPLLVISDGNDWTQTVPVSEFPYLQKVYSLYNKIENVENAHLAKEGHDYGISKRKAMYDFVVKNFHLNSKNDIDKDGNWDESKVKVEPATEMYVFRENVPFPDNAVKGIENIKKVLLQSQGK